jgi:hypothetical protein
MAFWDVSHQSFIRRVRGMCDVSTNYVTSNGVGVWELSFYKIFEDIKFVRSIYLLSCTKNAVIRKNRLLTNCTQSQYFGQFVLFSPPLILSSRLFSREVTKARVSLNTRCKIYLCLSNRFTIGHNRYLINGEISIALLMLSLSLTHTHTQLCRPFVAGYYKCMYEIPFFFD